jgi:DNA-binding MarR family transcriptional regulator
MLVEALDPGILPGPARLGQKVRFFARGSATCGGGALPCAVVLGRAASYFGADSSRWTLHNDTIGCDRNYFEDGGMSVRAPSELGLELAGFVPYRLNRLAVGVSNHLADIYRERFGLDIPEWRVMATVGSQHGCTAQHIAESTRMHKTRVSRAIAHLEERDLVERASSAADRREREVRLTKAGRRLYAELVPLVLERERQLLACLTKEQVRGFMAGMEALESFLGLQD